MTVKKKTGTVLARTLPFGHVEGTHYNIQVSSNRLCFVFVFNLLD